MNSRIILVLVICCVLPYIPVIDRRGYAVSFADTENERVKKQERDQSYVVRWCVNVQTRGSSLKICKLEKKSTNAFVVCRVTANEAEGVLHKSCVAEGSIIMTYPI